MVHQEIKQIPENREEWHCSTDKRIALELREIVYSDSLNFCWPSICIIAMLEPGVYIYIANFAIQLQARGRRAFERLSSLSLSTAMISPLLNILPSTKPDFCPLYPILYIGQPGLYSSLYSSSIFPCRSLAHATLIT